MEERRLDYERDEFDERLARIVSRVVRDADVGVYPEGGGEKGLLKWLLGLAASLLVAFVIGGVTMYGKLSAVEANQSSLQRQFDQLAAIVATLRRMP